MYALYLVAKLAELTYGTSRAEFELMAPGLSFSLLTSLFSTTVDGVIRQDLEKQPYVAKVRLDLRDGHLQVEFRRDGRISIDCSEQLTAWHQVILIPSDRIHIAKRLYELLVVGTASLEKITSAVDTVYNVASTALETIKETLVEYQNILREIANLIVHEEIERMIKESEETIEKINIINRKIEEKYKNALSEATSASLKSITFIMRHWIDISRIIHSHLLAFLADIVLLLLATNVESFSKRMIYIGNFSGIEDLILASFKELRELLEYRDKISNLRVLSNIVPDGEYDYALLSKILEKLPENSLLIIEEPEIHKNPSLICDLAEQLCHKVANSRNINIVLTTHSDTLVYMVAKQVEKKVLKPDDIRIYYVYRDKEHIWTQCKRLEIYEDGFVEDIPHVSEVLSRIF